MLKEHVNHNETKSCNKITNTGLLTYIEDLHFQVPQLLPLLSPCHGEGLLFNGPSLGWNKEEE